MKEIIIKKEDVIYCDSISSMIQDENYDMGFISNEKYFLCLGT